MRGRAGKFGVAGLAAGLALVGLPALQASAANFDVTNTNDSGPGSLRQAVADASAAGGADTVTIPAGLGTITLSSTINFTGADLTTVQGNGNTVSYPTSMPFNSSSTPYTLDGLTISGDQAANTSSGALTISNSTLNVDTLGANTSGGDLTITGTTINSSFDGANTASGALTFTDSTITSPSGTGLNTAEGDITVTGSNITNFSAGSGDGVNTGIGRISITDSQVVVGEDGISSNQGDITITRSSIIGQGGSSDEGVSNNVGLTTVVNSTVTGFLGNGISGGPTVVLVYATVINNGGAGEGEGENVEAGELSAFGSVVASPFDDCDVLTTTSNGYNYSNDATCGFTSTGDVQNGGDPGLGALADNGGPGMTFLPQSASPLLNAIPLTSCQNDGAAGITDDERSLPRPSGSGCEIGAVEVQVVPATTTTTSTTPPTSNNNSGNNNAGNNNASRGGVAVPRFTG